MIVNQRIIPVIVISLLLLVMTGCGIIDDQGGIEYISKQPNTPTSLIKYERTGGGMHSFIISDSGTYFEIHYVAPISSTENRDTTFMLSKAIVSPDDNVMLTRVFSGKQKISGTLYNQGLTGTWNEVYINANNSWIRVGNQIVIDELTSLEQKVDSIARFNLNRVASGLLVTIPRIINQ
jgi:hypothetical protein